MEAFSAEPGSIGKLLAASGTGGQSWALGGDEEVGAARKDKPGRGVGKVAGLKRWVDSLHTQQEIQALW